MMHYKDDKLSNVVKGCKAFEDIDDYYQHLHGQETTLYHVRIFNVDDNKDPMYLLPDSFAFVNWQPSFKTSPFKDPAFRYKKEAEGIANMINVFALYGIRAEVIEEKTII